MILKTLSIFSQNVRKSRLLTNTILENNKNLTSYLFKNFSSQLFAKFWAL